MEESYEPLRTLSYFEGTFFKFLSYYVRTNSIDCRRCTATMAEDLTLPNPY